MGMDVNQFLGGMNATLAIQSNQIDPDVYGVGDIDPQIAGGMDPGLLALLANLGGIQAAMHDGLGTLGPQLNIEVYTQLPITVDGDDYMAPLRVTVASPPDAAATPFGIQIQQHLIDPDQHDGGVAPALEGLPQGHQDALLALQQQLAALQGALPPTLTQFANMSARSTMTVTLDGEDVSVPIVYSVIPDESDHEVTVRQALVDPTLNDGGVHESLADLPQDLQDQLTAASDNLTALQTALPPTLQQTASVDVNYATTVQVNAQPVAVPVKYKVVPDSAPGGKVCVGADGSTVPTTWPAVPTGISAVGGPAPTRILAYTVDGQLYEWCKVYYQLANGDWVITHDRWIKVPG